MKQIIHRAYPPNYREILAVFPQASEPGVIFSWGYKIFNPNGRQIDRTLLMHEAVHGERQGTSLVTINAWWHHYLRDVQFRFDEELLAHRAEFKAYRGGRHGVSRAGHLHHVALRLSGPLYGGMCGYDEAIRMLKVDGTQAAA